MISPQEELELSLILMKALHFCNEDGVMWRFGPQQARSGSHARISVGFHEGEVSSLVSPVFQLIISDNYPKQSSSGTWWLTGSWIGLTGNKTSGTWVWVNNVTVETS